MIVVLIFHQLLTREQIWPIFQYELAMNKRACLKRKDELNFGVAFCCCWFFFFFFDPKKNDGFVVLWRLSRSFCCDSQDCLARKVLAMTGRQRIYTGQTLVKRSLQ